MNYGIALPQREKPGEIPTDLTRNGYGVLSFHLYHKVASVDLEGMEVLEVGCGRGGGARFLAEKRGVKRMVGMDISERAIEHANNVHGGVGNLEFDCGDAEALPYEDGTFDAVISVESSHGYPNENAFFQEAHRVLKPGGHFLLADFRPTPKAIHLRDLFMDSPLWEVEEVEDITEGVVQSMELEDGEKRQLVMELAGPQHRPGMLEFAGVVGSSMYRRMKNRNVLYLRFALRRKGD